MWDLPQNSIEFIAAAAGILCVFLQTRENIYSWPFGVLSALLFVYIFAVSNLTSDMILNVFYVGLNFYGWWFWLHGGAQAEEAKIQYLTRKQIRIGLIFIAVATLVWGYLIPYINPKAELVYLDAFTTVGSLIAQYSLAKKYIQNWTLWIIVDVVAVGMYAYKELYFTMIMFIVFLFLCVVGMRQWKANFADQMQDAVQN